MMKKERILAIEQGGKEDLYILENAMGEVVASFSYSEGSLEVIKMEGDNQTYGYAGTFKWRTYRK